MGDDDLKQLIAELEAAFKLGNSQASDISFILIGFPYLCVIVSISHSLEGVGELDQGMLISILAPIVFLVAWIVLVLATYPQRERLKSNYRTTHFLSVCCKMVNPEVISFRPFPSHSGSSFYYREYRPGSPIPDSGISGRSATTWTGI